MKPLSLSILAAALLPLHAAAFEAFEVKDIRVEGIQRTEAGTVFTYLPVKVGDTLTADKASAAIQALYATGFFTDVRLERQGAVLNVLVQERPAIASVEFTGMKEFQKDDIRAAFKSLGLTEGRILDRSLLDRASQELKRQYYNRGFYAVNIQANTSPLERNRQAVSFEVVEGEPAKIREINLIGTKAFKEKKLLDMFVQRTPGWLTWFTKHDLYSKQKLSADLETLRSHYLNNGYLEFNIESTQVSISPDKQSIQVTVNLKEGEKFTVSNVALAGDLVVGEAELKPLIPLKAGDVFSRERLNEAVKKIGDRLGNEGFAFANVNAAPEINREKREVAFTLLIDPGRKVYVNRVNIAGNSRTKDEVIRREMRQMEGAWYDLSKINRSRDRVERLGYFKEVNIETPAVAGTPDQVDVNVSVSEQATGSVMIGAGFSSSDGLVLTGSLSQNNLFGTGNRLSLSVNTSDTNTTYAVSHTNPYFTPDGISLGWDAYLRETDTSSTTSVATYAADTTGIGMRLGIPTSETNSLQLGILAEQYKLKLTSASPTYYVNYATTSGGNSSGLDNTSLKLDAGWSYDTRNSVLNPTKGNLHRVYGEVIPFGDLKYYKLNYQHQYFRPMPWTHVTLAMSGDIGWGGGLGGKDMPFWRNYFVGGIGSVRGFDNGSLGPKVLDPNGSAIAIGGDKKLTGSAELLFPFPGATHEQGLRLSAFVDVGSAFGPGDKDGKYAQFSLADLRASTGLAVTWLSPMGPLKFSLAKPLKKQTDDKTQTFQFQMGTAF